MKINRIGKYKLTKILGEGSFAQVRLGEHESVKQQKVAVKILQKTLLKTKDFEKRLKREIKFSKHFHHPNIIRLYEIIETNMKIFLIMEYASGGDLYSLVCTRKLSENEARRLFQQIILGCEYLHIQQVSHRDLKLENILLDEDNNIKIADFGLSNFMRDGIFLYTSCGSPNYAAPELINGRIYDGAAVDVWSCGVILYTMVAGYLPFEEESIPKLYQKIRENKYSLPVFLSQSVKDLIFRMLQADPLNRISIQEIKRHKWFNQGIELFKILDNLIYCYSHLVEVSQDILNKIIQYEVNLEGLDIEGLQKCIKAKEKNSFTVLYEILESQQLKKKIEDKQKHLNNEEHFFRKLKRPYEQEEKLKKIRKSFCRHKIVEMNDWRIGILCQKDCFVILTEILKCLQNNYFRWKIVSSSYKIKAKKIFVEESNDSYEEILCIMIHIFSVPETKNEYLVDFHRLSGNHLEFLDFGNSFFSSVMANDNKLIIFK